MLKSRIVAIALISIILSSSSVSVANGYTIWFNVNEINASPSLMVAAKPQIYKIKLFDILDASTAKKFADITDSYQINLFDGASSSIINEVYDKGKPYQINLFDGIASILNNYENKDQSYYKKYQKIISIGLSDGVGTDTSDYNNDDSKIVLIKQNDDKKAIWERIFPLDRIRNISKSFFKIIQNDHSLSYLQISEISSNDKDYSIEQTTIYGSELENLSEFEKFAGKSSYVADQIGIRAFNLLDVEKFIGKSGYVADQLSIHVQHLSDPEKFIGKAGYVADQLSIRAQHLSDPEKFVDKSRFVGQQITIQVYQVVDPKNPTLLVLLIPLIGIVLIRNENDKIKFYHIQKIVSFIFAVILISSAVITPFSYSVMYWGRAFAQEDPLGKDVGPPDEPLLEQFTETVEEIVEEIVPEPPVEEPVLPPEYIPVEPPIELPVEEPVGPPLEEKIPEPIVNDISTEQAIIETGNDLTITFDENLILTEDNEIELYKQTIDEPTQYNQTISLDETFKLIDDTTSSLYNDTEIPSDNLSSLLPEYLSFTDDIILSLHNQTNVQSLPNATESWQFENDTNNADLIGDAEIDYTEGINGTSLLLDGNYDFAQANSTNATTYITDMSIAAWIKPNYTNGSPEFTIVSKGKSFVLSVNNIIEPEHIAKFSVFDGIKWTTVESYSTIPDDSWSHITARFNKTTIEMYVNGTLEDSTSHGGVPYVSEKGQIELKTVEEITSYYDIVIGASLTPNMESRAFNMFSGMIDGVQLFDSRLESEDVMKLYLDTVPIIAPLPESQPRSIPAPSLRYRILKGNETELPVAIPAEDLNEDLTQLTVSTWIKPNYTNGSPEFTILGKENSFVLSLNKIVLPERVAKFAVYDGITWHTVTGSTPINDWSQVAATVNGSNILLYVNGTLDGRLDTGPSAVSGSTRDVIIGAYENTLRGEAKLSNYYSGIIQEATVYRYDMDEREIQEQFSEYLNQYTNASTGITAYTLNDSLKSVDRLGISNSIQGKPESPYEEISEILNMEDDILLKLNGILLGYVDESIKISDDLILLLNNQTVSGPANHTISLAENLLLQDIILPKPTIDSTTLSEGLLFYDDLFLKLNNMTFLILEENLGLSEQYLVLLNNETVNLLEITNSSSSLTHSEIEIGKPVLWTQTVMLNETDDLSNILVELPADAQNITINKIEDGNSTEITEEFTEIIEPELEPVENEYDIPYYIEMSLDEIAEKHNARHVVPLDYATLEDIDEIKQKDKPTKVLLINETNITISNVTSNEAQIDSSVQNQTETEYKIQFETPAPYTIEQENSTPEKFQKNVTVAHDSTLHYTDVKSYTDIPEYLVQHNTDFRLHWMINDTKVDVTDDPRFAVTFADTDGNRIADRMEWIVPQLSEQEFGIEADIVIINVQSYPTVGGNWTVYFNTTGTADLTITGILGTTFGELQPDDLKFLELNNGTYTLSPIVNLTANTITYYNYSSSVTGFEASRVLTSGVHHLEFKFGNDIAYAHNSAQIFQDDFNRANNNAVGNGWTEAETLATDLKIASNRLDFDSNNENDLPRIKHTFDKQTTGKLRWSYTFNFDLTGAETTYEARMQLGDSAIMNDGSPDTTGVAVNLIWGSVDHGLTNTEGFGTKDGAVVTQRAIVSGPAGANVGGDATITVDINLDANTYDLTISGPGFISGTRSTTGIPFDNNVDIDEIRIYLDELGSGNFGALEFDNMVIKKIDLDDIEVSVGRFTLSSTPGLYQKITGVGFEPKAIMFISTPNDVNDADSISANGMGFSIGMTDGKNSFVVATSRRDADPSNDNDEVGRRALEDYVILRLQDTSNTQPAVGLAALASMDPDGFTLYIEDDFQQPDGGFVEYVAYGGEGVTPHVGRVTLANNGQEIDVTGIGFEPDLIISSFVGTFVRGEADPANDDVMMSLGWAINPDIQAANNQFSMSVGGAPTNSTQTNSRFDTNFAGAGIQDNANDPGYNFTNFFSGGFTVTTRIENSGTNPVDAFGYLALDLGESPEVYTTSRAARQDTNDDIETGAGFQPVFLMAVGSAVVNSGEVDVLQTNGASFAMGITNETDQYAIEYYDQDAALVSNTASRTSSNAFIQAPDHSGAINYEADFLSFDANGWTLDYTNAANDDYQIAFLAIGDNYQYDAPPPVDLMQPDAGAPGMHLAVNFIGDHFNSTQTVTTNSPYIVVGPTSITNEKNYNVTSGGQVLQTTFFINASAPPGDVTVSIDGVNVTPKFKIIDVNNKFVGTGNYSTAAPGTYTLGDDDGINGNRTKGGTIVLENLIVPNGVILNINVTDIDQSTPANEGLLPAIIIVQGDVNITGIITVNGTDGQNGAGDVGGDGGAGGSGGGGGGAGGGEDGNGGTGGAGFTGGGGGGCDENGGGRLGGIGGIGTGGVGLADHRLQCEGSSGGGSLVGNHTGGGPGGERNAEGAGGGGGTGFVFGSGGAGGTGESAPDGNGVGGLGGGGGGDVGDNRKGGGGGFGEEGTEGGNDAAATGGGLPGRINGNATLIPLAGGSGGGGGGNNDDGAGADDGSGGGGGGGGAILIFGQGIFDVTTNGRMESGGGDGGTTTDDADSGEGGGGSGGGIILQGRSVDTSAGDISAVGGTGPNGGGDGGDGRVRVDGVRPGATTIEGLVGGYGGSQYVGPSITGFNGTHINGTGALNANVTVVVQHSTGGTDYYRFLQVDANGQFRLPISFTDGAHYITGIQNSTFTDSVMSSAATHIVFKRTLKDSVSVEDYITLVMQVRDDMGTADDLVYKAPVTMRPSDTSTVDDKLRFKVISVIKDSVSAVDTLRYRFVVSIEDDLATVEDIVVKAPVTMKSKDSAIVEDSISTRVTFRITDSAVVDDTLRYRFVVSIEDDLATVEDIVVKAPVTLRPSDTALVEDVLRATTTKAIKDSAVVDDTLRYRFVVSIEDDLATVEDIVVKAPVTLRPSDTALVEDVLRATTTKAIKDSAVVDDLITWTLTRRVQDDLATVEDIVVKAPVTLRPSDTALVEDVLRATTTKAIKDSAVVDDLITWTLTRRVQDDLATVEDIVVKAPVTLRPSDTALVEDVLRATTTKAIKDSAVVDDVITSRVVYGIADTSIVDDNITWKLTRSISDSALVNDIVSFYATMRMQDHVLVDDLEIIAILGIHSKVFPKDSADVDDTILIRVTKKLSDTATVDDTLPSRTIYSLSDSALADDTIRTTLRKMLSDSATVDDTISKRITYRLEDSALADDVLRATTITVLKDSALADDTIRTTLRKMLSDSATVDDTISKRITYRLEDSALADDVLRATTITVLKDSALADDTIRTTLRKMLSDSATVDDTISKRITYRLEDSALADDVLRATTITVLKDSALADDTIRTTLRKMLSDSATVDDTISKRITYRLEDSALADDVLRATTITVLKDSALADDTIRTTLRKMLSDSATVDDVLRATTITVLKDSATVDDTISKRITYRLEDSALADDTIRTTISKPIFDSGTISDSITMTVFYRPQDSVSVDDDIVKVVFIISGDQVLVDDNIRIRLNKTMFDSGTVDDSITKTVFYRPQDSVSVDDDIVKVVFIISGDQVLVDDNIRVIIRKTMFDSGTVDDSITMTVFYRPQDSVLVKDDIVKIAFIISGDQVLVDDNIRVIIRKTMFDSGTVEDSITMTVFYRPQDSVSVDDDIIMLVKIFQEDAVLISDTLRPRTVKPVFDSGTVDDSITMTVFYRPQDSALVNDDIVKVAFIISGDQVLVDDTIRVIIRKTMFDSGTVDDSITMTVFYRPQDSALVNDDIVKVAFIISGDQVLVDDTIRVIIRKTMFDSGTVDDSITMTVFYRPQDSALVNDDIVKVAFIISGDQVLVDDTIRVIIRKTMFDSGTVEDSITMTVFYRPQDSVSVDDDIIMLVKIFQEDAVLISDTLRPRTVKPVFDSGTVDDSITMTVFYRPQDSALVNDDIVKVAFIISGDQVLVDDTIRVIIRKTMFDSGTVDDTITKTVFYRPQDSALVQDDIRMLVKIFQEDAVLISDTLRPRTVKPVFDSGTVSDSITKTVFYRPQDSVSAHDDIIIIAFIFPSDLVSVDDFIISIIIKPLSNTALVDDTISKTVTYRLEDTISTQDILSKRVTIAIKDEMASVDDLIIIAPVTFRPSEVSLVDDSIRKTVTYRISDTATANDQIRFRYTSSIKDTTLVDDQIKWRLTRAFKDTASVDDVLSFRATLITKDAAMTDDRIRWTLTRAFHDTASVDDSIKIKIIKSIKDSATVNDTVIPTVYYRRLMLDEISGNDITILLGAINIENRQLNGTLLAEYSEYLIIPNPFTGTGLLRVNDTTLGFDSDGTDNNGQINIIRVPFGTYRINQTAIDIDYSSVIIFTYVTTHVTDINATALFRVFDTDTTVLNTIPAIDSDILDIANYRFDEIVLNNQLTRVLNGTQEPLYNVTKMPAPVFVGVDNQNAVFAAADSQYTLLYKNLNLTPNDTPEDIRAAFDQTAYDAGNFTQTTFVGVFSATAQSSFGQYLATQPFDKFNCGQQYVYSLDDTLVPTFGGINRTEFTIDQNGVCPDSEDYITFEIASVPPAGSGAPTLSGKDILLYVNPQFPNGSITGIGVDFSVQSNIYSFNYTIISRLPQTGNINDITVYLDNGGWSTAGVTELSRQLIPSGPNAGKVEITVSVDYLAKMIVGGMRIPPPPPPPPPPILNGFGPTLVGPAAGVAGGAPDQSTARIHRVEYDVCNENISRILVGHDSSKPPLIQLLTTKSGIINAKLADIQPFADQNKFTLVDRYLFEAPLAPGESIFTIFAVDYRSNVQRTLVQVEGCQGVITFIEDQIILPHIFDFKYRIDNGTYIRPSTDYHYINEGQEPTVSAIVDSPVVPLRKAELYVSTLGSIEQTILPMDIVPLLLQDLENVSVISSIIPDYILKGPAVEYWIRIVTEEGIVQESVHHIVGVKPAGYSGESSAEMDTITIKAQGTSIKPTAYLTNEGEIPVYGAVSLLVDGEKVHSTPVLLTPGQNRISLEWSIPKSADTAHYTMQTLLEVYDKSYITGVATLDAFVRTKIVPISEDISFVPATDKLGNTIARPAMMYSSNDGTGEFRVTAPDGTCVIGAGCLVEQSTLKHRGGIDSVIIDGHIYRVRYSGADSPLERFSITSLDSVLGNWNVSIEDNSMFTAAAAIDVSVKVQYRAERSPMVTVGME